MRRAVLIIAAFALCMALCGCYSSTELNDLAIVMGIAIDKGGKPDEYLITAQVVRPSSIKTPPDEGAGAQGKPYINMKKEGVGINMPMHEMMRLNSRRLYTAHNQVIIVSVDVAKDGIASVLDYFIRSHEGRFSVPLVIALNNAGDILTEEVDLEPIPAKNIKSLLESQFSSFDASQITLFTFLSDMLSAGIEPTAPVVELYNDENGGKRVRIAGTAVFKDGKLSAILTPAQTRAMKLVKNHIYNDYVTVEAFDSHVSLNMVKSKSVVTPVIKDGNVSVTIQIHQECLLVGLGEGISIDKEKISEIERISAESIIKNIQETVSSTQSLGVDVFGFGEMLYKRDPEAAEPMLADWGSVYPNIDIEYKVDVAISGTGAIYMPMLPVGEGG